MSTNKPYKKRVAIIGAGVSGLRAASVLLRRKQFVEVKVFEATEQVGGRVRQKMLGEQLKGGDLVDEGANWIHGSSDTHSMTRICRELSIPLKEYLHPATIDSKGVLLPKETSHKLEDEMWKNVEYAQEFARLNFKDIPADVSLYDFLVEKVKLDYPDDPNKQKLVLDHCHIWGHYIGDDVRKQSLKHFFLEENCAGENLFVAGTYKRVIAKVAEPAVEASIVQLESEVTSIRTTKRANLVTYIQKGQTREYECDAVILTIPLGCLKDQQIAFDPPLPPRILKSIDGMNYGHLEKVYIKFTKAWWDVPGIRKWDHIVFQSPSYAATKRNPNLFPMTAFSMSCLPDPCARPTLLFYLYGDLSRKVTNMELEITEMSEGFWDVYDLLTPYFAQLPGYRTDNEDVIPMAITRSNWYNEKFAGYGSYTNVLVNNERGAEDITELRKGLPERRIYLAGEHVAPLVGMGTVTGAYWSGETAASRVLQEVVGTTVPSQVAQSRIPEDVMIAGRNPKLGYDVHAMAGVLEKLRTKEVLDSRRELAENEVRYRKEEEEKRKRMEEGRRGREETEEAEEAYRQKMKRLGLI